MMPTPAWLPARCSAQTHVAEIAVPIVCTAAAAAAWLSRPLDGRARVLLTVAAIVLAWRIVYARAGCSATYDRGQLTLWQPRRPTAAHRQLMFGRVSLTGAVTVVPAGRAWWGERLVQIADDTGRAIVTPESILHWAQRQMLHDAVRRTRGRR